MDIIREQMCYQQLWAFITGPATRVLKLFFEVKILENSNFETFLNDRSNMHILFHQRFPAIHCCECKQLSLFAPRKKGVMTQRLFEMLYESSGVPQPNHETSTGSEVIYFCLCKYSAKCSFGIRELDISLLNDIIQWCCPSKMNYTWRKNIKDVRNYLAHTGNGKVSKEDFEGRWKTLKTATLGFAAEIGSLCTEMFVEEISRIEYSTTAQLKEVLEKSNDNQIKMLKAFSGLEPVQTEVKELNKQIKLMRQQLNVPNAQLNKIELSKEQPSVLDVKDHSMELEHVDENENFFKVAQLENILCCTLKDVLKCEVDRTSASFEQFINVHQHIIYHLCFNTECCLCTDKGPKQFKKILDESHLGQILDEYSRLSGHVNGGNCYCCCKAKKKISITTIDTYLTCVLLLYTCKGVFWHCCLDSQSCSLGELLVRNKHKLYHLWHDNTYCCQCKEEFMNNRQNYDLFKQDWKTLFNKTSVPCEKHKQKASNELICCVDVSPNIRIDNLGSELQNIILDNVCPLKDKIRSVVKDIIDIYVHSNKGMISCEDFKVIYNHLKRVITDITIIFSTKNNYIGQVEKISDGPFDESRYRIILMKYQEKYISIQTLNQKRSEGLESHNLKHTQISTVKHEKQGCRDRDMDENCQQLNSMLSKEYAKDIILTKQVTIIRNRTQNLNKRINDLLSKRESEITSIANEKEDFQKSIEDCKIEVLFMLDKVKEEGLQIMDINLIKKRSSNKEMSILKKSVTDIAIHHLRASEKDILVSLPRIEEDLRRLENRLSINFQDKEIDGSEQIVKLKTNGKITIQISYDPGKQICQALSATQDSYSIKNIQRITDMQLKESFDFEVPSEKQVSNITGCTILEDGSMCFLDSKCSSFIFKMTDGLYKTFNLPTTPLDITAISNSRVAILHRTSVAILNVNDMQVENFKFKSRGKFRFITFHYENLIVCVGMCSFFIINLQGQKIKEININETLISCITCWNNNIFYANRDKNNIFRVNLETGESTLVMNVGGIVKSPSCIASDGCGNIFVSGSDKNNIVVMSVSTLDCKELVRGLKNIKYPKAIAFDATNRRLLTCSVFGYSAVYSIGF